MKRFTSVVVATVLLTAALAANGETEAPPPGQVDFGTFAPPGGGAEFVEVNLSGSLISMAARLVQKQEPEVAQVLNGLQRIRVNVVGVNDENRSDLESRIVKIRKEMETKGWERIVTVQQQSQDVGIYLKTLNKDTVQGMVAVIKDGDKQAVFVNIVGDIKPEQLSMLGERFHIDPLKELGHSTEK